jgi:hypothetical protein
MAEKIYAKGIYFNKKGGNAPDFVLGKISIKKEALIEWLGSLEVNESGYINLDILEGKEGKPFISLNTWKKEEKKSGQPVSISKEEDLPF